MFPKIILTLLLISFKGVIAQNPSDFIHVDQFGYQTEAQKVAVISNPEIGYNSILSYEPPEIMEIRDAETNDVVLSVAPQVWNNGVVHEQSGDRGWWLDFSSLETPGAYYVLDPTNDEQSAVFEIRNDIYASVMRAAGRMFYYNRCNAPKSEPYAQGWSDGMNFSNPLQDGEARYIFDQTNASLEKDLSGGWFDAGDYNKYVTFAVSAVHDLLSAYEENPQAFTDDWNIPESENTIPDLLDELKWELDWLLKMNNADGSTILKIGSQNFEENIASPPSANTDGRYYGPTCTAASIAVASMFSHAAKVYAEIPELEDYSQELLERAITSYNYVLPFVNNNALETACDDGSIVAGDADWEISLQIETMIMASVYLFEHTGDPIYNDFIVNRLNDLETIQTNFWGPYKVHLFDALLLYAELPETDTITANTITTSFSQAVINDTNDFFGLSDSDLYRAPMPDFSYHWGSSNPKASYGVLNRVAIDALADPSQNESLENYIDGAIHYFHGVNPQGLVYLSNMYEYGAERTVNEIYHSWFFDGTDYDHALDSPMGPAPGFVTGGPNHYFSVTSLTPPSGQPRQKSYLDFNDGYPLKSWEISEPAIYYQASYIRLLANRIIDDEVLSVSDIFQSGTDFKLYPNPAKNIFQVDSLQEGDYIQVFSKSGQFVKEFAFRQQGGYPVSGLASGMYFVKVQSANGASVKKLIVE